MDRIAAEYFLRHKSLGSRARREISEAVFGVTRWQMRLDAWLSMAGVVKPSILDRVICYLFWQGASTELPHHLAFLKKVDFSAPFERSFPGGLQSYLSMPQIFYSRIVAMYPSRSFDACEMMNRPIPPSLRANLLKGKREDAISRLRTDGIDALPTGHSPFGIRIPQRVNLRESSAYREGLVEVQDEGSQLATLVAAGAGGRNILDLCAGAGGKSLMLAMLAGGSARIVASDPDSGKLSELKKRARRAGAAIDVIGSKELSKRGDLRGKFDLILVDAPCTGSGTIRRNPDVRWRVTDSTIARSVSLQRDILKSAVAWLAPGGRFVYLTCSIFPEENEEQALWILKNLPLSPGPISEIGGTFRGYLEEFITPEGFLRIDPSRGDWDGFFVASFYLSGENFV
ncbi:MAG TPA: RsmB/NOP family class I SAM-dependent RNA methyltransferase, partial [bacterium]|nr:RsmB/NOP family class I SAM-dependent RNA methyltransferase [bacterium]